MLIDPGVAAVDVIRVVGAVYLVYLAISSFRAAARSDGLDPPQARPEPGRARRIFGRASLTNLANPKVIAFYLAFFPPSTRPAGT
ncbi:hypothetical protein GCM10010404_49830 [Nonomuraea africana]|uniref:Threonine/homoserine/homoserine lactone efflux protein n=1 Tax=Nonomuraea africana TaxID=46171 RepID=A0ABR9KVJ6_9ACTN|nr:LysE family transporter [Nonomuraea africana]MBE1566049.1 threonine/homoserine/homoserine lactone efflux protein [Nonomuraea africana]